MSVWVTPESIGATWPDAARLPAADVALYLEAAQAGVEAYAPAEILPADGAPVPARLRLAVILHARDIHNATQRTTGDLDVAGDAGYAFRVRPLSDAVKYLARPPGGRPRFGNPGASS